jgi:hypothetical protein
VQIAISYFNRNAMGILFRSQNRSVASIKQKGRSTVLQASNILDPRAR